jgi:carbamoyl-phosphate synthase small subunit
MITAQNHGFSVDLDFFQTEKFINSGGVCELNLNDKTVEGFYMKEDKILSIQYHPEAGPGPNDALYLFDRFKSMLS